MSRFEIVKELFGVLCGAKTTPVGSIARETEEKDATHLFRLLRYTRVVSSSQVTRMNVSVVLSDATPDYQLYTESRAIEQGLRLTLVERT